MNSLEKLKDLILRENLDGYLIPSNDQFMNEFVPESEQRLKFITNFSGSNGEVLVLAKGVSKFFTDGRYILQAELQLDPNNFEIYNMAKLSLTKFLATNDFADKKIGFNPYLYSNAKIASLKEYAFLVPYEKDLVDDIWKDKPAHSIEKYFKLEDNFSGLEADKKIIQVIKSIPDDIDGLFITDPASVNWLFNIRGRDVFYTPFAFCYCILQKPFSAVLYLDKSKLDKQTEFYLENYCKLETFDQVKNKFLSLKDKIIQTDYSICPYQYQILAKTVNLELVNGRDPIIELKACKNKYEQENAITAHKYDGLALSNFFYWLDSNIGKINISELDVSDKLLEFRSSQPDFFEESFPTIAGYKDHGAIIHYQATKETNYNLKPESILLVDSGGQYKTGTTDVTRTVALGQVDDEIKEDFTNVLKGHIALADIKFPANTTGSQLDVLARQFLWQDGKDYDHGTGHGVGSFLCVHEGPHRISKFYNDVSLKEGMIISNEPGYYKKGSYGIRIENLVIVEKNEDNFLRFKTITLTPIDLKLINVYMLTEAEKKWLNLYHENVYQTLSDLTEDTGFLEWLKENTKQI